MSEKDNAVTIHVRNLQLLQTETFKTQHSLNLRFVKELFVSKNNRHALRTDHPFKLVRPPNYHFWGKNILLLEGKFWHELCLETKQCVNLNRFKTRIKNWKAEECSCHLCRHYVAQVGFISRNSRAYAVNFWCGTEIFINIASHFCISYAGFDFCIKLVIAKIKLL